MGNRFIPSGRSWTLPELLEVYREKSGYTPETAAKLLHMSEDVYKGLESGETVIDIFLIDTLIKAFNLPKVAKQIAYDPRKPAYSHQLTKFRIRAGLTQQAVAAYLKCAQVTYAGYETGRSVPDINTLSALADKYDTSVDILIGRGVPLKEIAYFSTKRDSEYNPETPSDYTDEEWECYRPKTKEERKEQYREWKESSKKGGIP